MSVRLSYATSGRRGYVLVAALAIVTLLAVLGVSIFLQAGSGLIQSRNQHCIQAATLQAESGMAYLSFLLRQTDVPITIKTQATMDAVAAGLNDRLDGAGALGGQAIAYDGTRIVLPPMSTGAPGESFDAELWMSDERTLCARVTGRAGAVSRTVEMNFRLEGGHPIFGFGISSKGPICLENIIQIQGKNEPAEARLLSMSPGQAFRLQGTLTLEGDIYATDPLATVTIGGDGTIAGTSMADPAVYDHVHIGEGVANFPEVDTSVFETFATNVVDSSTVTSGLKTFQNIRIKAGTNPTFSNGVKLDGVVFIEKPNQVTFAQGTTVTGVICTQDAGVPGPDNVIKFEVNTQSRGVDELPDTDEFHELRQMTGSFILAPGFRVKFENESGVINGMIAAGHVKFENSFNGTLVGGIISYGNDEIMGEDFSRFTIDHSKYSGIPAGFKVGAPHLVPDAGTYVEH